METKSKNLILLEGKCKKAVEILLAPLYFFGAHWYDAICGYVSNEFTFASALVIMFLFLTLLSVALIVGHRWVEKKYNWDLMGLNEFKGVHPPLPWWKIFKRFKLWMTKNRKTSFWIGNIVIGPPIIAILLREKDDWMENVKYVVSGAALSVIFWVSTWAGIGYFTWEQYIKPFIKNLTV